MTALCGGGTSSAKVGFGSTVALTVPAIAALLNNIPTIWAVPFAAYLGLINYDLTTFCASDPPPVPNITAADAAALLTVLDPIGHTQAVAKFEQLVGAYAWHSLCDCDAVPTPPPPAAPAAPPGLPQINPPAVAPPQLPATPCFVTPAFTRGVNAAGGNWPFASGLGLGGRGITSLQMVIHTTVVQAPGWSTTFMVQQMTINNNVTTVVRTDNIEVPAGQDMTVVLPMMAGVDKVQFIQGGGTGGGITNGSVLQNYFCGGTYPGSTLTPCPPDTVAQGLLQQILELVKLIQRQKAPFAYVPGTRHNGLTGNGQFAVQGLLGVSVILATLPPYLGNLAGDPPELFDVGYVTLGTADGWHRSVRIDHSPTLVLPIEGSETLLGYSLSPGVVVDVLELRREF